MAKHPVPKKKKPRCRSRSRSQTFRNLTVKKLSSQNQFAPCPNCASPKLLHHVCLGCGQHQGRQIIDQSRKIDRITTIKA